MAERTPKLRKDGRPKQSGGARKGSGNPCMKPQALDPDVSRRSTQLALEVASWPEIDLNDLDALQKRVTDFFDLCSSLAIKPPVSGLALSLGFSRDQLLGVVSGRAQQAVEAKRALWTVARQRNLTPEATSYIKKAHKMMELLWEANFTSGSIQPVVGIFLGKNNYGYKDQVETVVTPSSPLQSPEDVQAIVESAKASLPEPDEG